MLTLERDGTLRHCSSAARRLLLYVTLDSVNRGTVAQQEAAITGLMRELAAQLTAVFGERDDVAVAPPSLHVTNRWGRFVLRAHWLTDDVHDARALIGVQIRRQEPTVLRLTGHAGTLSPQRREVGLMLAQESQPGNRRALDVTLSTAATTSSNSSPS
jgi:hypothetical protein